MPLPEWLQSQLADRGIDLTAPSTPSSEASPATHDESDADAPPAE